VIPIKTPSHLIMEPLFLNLMARQASQVGGYNFSEDALGWHAKEYLCFKIHFLYLGLFCVVIPHIL
jgi:hypothetical protein